MNPMDTAVPNKVLADVSREMVSAELERSFDAPRVLAEAV